MRVVIRYASWLLALVAIAVTATAWLGEPPDLDAADAADVATGSLAAAGRDGRVVGEPVLATHRTVAGEEIEAWFVDVAVDGETIELRVQADAGQLVYVDDNVEGEVGQLLDDDEFAVLGDYRDDAVLDEWVLRNAAGTVAAASIGGVAAMIPRRRPRRDPTTDAQVAT